MLMPQQGQWKVVGWMGFACALRMHVEAVTGIRLVRLEEEVAAHCLNSDKEAVHRQVGDPRRMVAAHNGQILVVPQMLNKVPDDQSMRGAGGSCPNCAHAPSRVQVHPNFLLTACGFPNAYDQVASEEALRHVVANFPSFQTGPMIATHTAFSCRPNWLGCRVLAVDMRVDPYFQHFHGSNIDSDQVDEVLGQLLDAVGGRDLVHNLRGEARNWILLQALSRRALPIRSRLATKNHPRLDYQQQEALS
mmetsp:Transcript_34932/g.72752  ORF Transcript_34932/g.72752 Transcript_34932/m.72752 type:complete len:248 (-) Transcript_34932:20-763(-)